MFYENKYPYLKALEGSDGKIYYIFNYENGTTTSGMSKCPGELAIDYCELDLTEFKEKVEKFKSMEYSYSEYNSIADFAYEISISLKEKHFFAHFFLSYAVTNILNRQVILDDHLQLDDVYRDDIQRIKIIFDEFINLQTIFRDAIKFCLDNDNLPNRHLSEKLVGFLYQYPAFNNYRLLSGYVLTPTKNNKLNYETVSYMNDENITDAKEQLEIMHEDNKILSLMNYTVIEDFCDLMYYEFMHIMKTGRRIKICKNCGRYFVLKDKRKREYCDRIFEGDKTCKDIGAAIKFKKSLGDENDPLKIAHGMYNTMYSRMARAQDKLPNQKSDIDISEDEFIEWSNLYSKYRKDYVEKKISGDEFLKLISPGK